MNTPTHPLDVSYKRLPRNVHPKIREIKDWEKKISWPWFPAARLRRRMLKRGINPYRVAPQPLSNNSKNWSEYYSLLNAARSNLATIDASTYGSHSCIRHNISFGIRGEKDIPHELSGGFHPYCKGCETRNEFVDNPKLLFYTCIEGKNPRGIIEALGIPRSY